MQHKKTKIIEGPLKGKTLEVYDQNLLINGDVLACNIVCTDNVEVRGEISESSIRLNGGNLSVSKSIKNCNARIFGDLRCFSIEESEVKSSYGAVYVEKGIYLSKVDAMSLIWQTDEFGEVLSSTLRSTIEIFAERVGQFGNNQENRLELKTRTKHDLFELFFIYKQKLSDKEKELEKLSRYIKVFTLIKDKIHSLAEDKKTELIKKIKEYNALKKEVDGIKMEKKRVFMKNPEEDKYNRAVLVKNAIYPPAVICIDGKEMEVAHVESSVGFYKSGILILGELEKIYKKRNVVALAE